MAGKREWYVAVGDMSGEYEGNPLSFDASEIFGPFTAAQALELSKMDETAPHASFGIVIFKAQKLPFRSLRKQIRERLKEAIADQAATDAEMIEIRNRNGQSNKA
jgi:hypothetical protein